MKTPSARWLKAFNLASITASLSLAGLAMSEPVHSWLQDSMERAELGRTGGVSGSISMASSAGSNNNSSANLRNEKASDLSGRSLELGTMEKMDSSKLLSEEKKVILNDPAIEQAWGLKQASAQKAWEVSQGDKRIVVAVIDTGCDVNHEDLKKNIIPGWNFVSNNNDVTDNHGHGTHIAGIIGAEAGNGRGIAGVSPKVSIMCLKYFDPKFPKSDHLRNTIAAIRYAVKMKVDIINYSGGGTEFSADEKQAIDEARKAGILFVAAAGNERTNSDHNKYYPADYGLSNIISVTAINQKTEVLPSSNYGVETVDLAAPGYDIVSTLPGNAYGKLTGTSQATAFVTGAAVLIKARFPSFSAEATKKYVLNTGDSTQLLAGKTRTSRQLNLYKALTILDSDVNAAGIAVTQVKEKFTVDPIADLGPQAQIGDFGRRLLNSVQGSQPRIRSASEL